mmetsp:Transcript_76029/g.217006  ORF Transcript_76029/g.217006 Transcript_76029/m.217006 type:complete len:277 (-) Transcript_76029:154-984(-)
MVSRDAPIPMPTEMARGHLVRRLGRSRPGGLTSTGRPSTIQNAPTLRPPSSPIPMRLLSRPIAPSPARPRPPAPPLAPACHGEVRRHHHPATIIAPSPRGERGPRRCEAFDHHVGRLYQLVRRLNLSLAALTAARGDGGGRGLGRTFVEVVRPFACCAAPMVKRRHGGGLQEVPMRSRYAPAPPIRHRAHAEGRSPMTRGVAEKSCGFRSQAVGDKSDLMRGRSRRSIDSGAARSVRRQACYYCRRDLRVPEFLRAGPYRRRRRRRRRLERGRAAR